MTTEKIVSYTVEQTAQAVEAYSKGVTVEQIAEALARLYAP